MKKGTLLLLGAILCSPILFAKIITVSNNPNSPGQYKTLGDAIAAAAPGDILLVSGSVTDYNINGALGGSLSIDKPLTLYGQGYDPRKDQALASTISVLHLTAGSAGSIISGFAIGNIFADAGTNNIVISRCKITTFGYNYGGNGGRGINGNNYDLRENIIGGSIPITTNSSDILIHNNLILGTISASANTDIKIYNNYFSGSINSLSNSTVSNNIFYYKSATPTGNPYVGAGVSNCNFRNNIYFNSTNINPLQIDVNSNTGENNLSINPAFININLATVSVTRADDFLLQLLSPALGTGVGGVDIGPHGGSISLQYPYSGAPSIPQILAMNILNPVISSSDTLHVTFKASSNF